MLFFYLFLSTGIDTAFGQRLDIFPVPVFFRRTPITPHLLDWLNFSLIVPKPMDRKIVTL